MAEPDDRIWDQFITDRGQASHAINLFDIQQKYADVVPTAEVVAHLRSLPQSGGASRAARTLTQKSGE